ncbi:hypothetical protein L2E82_18744 [Cichorium intybus]|uniref:Uncharacterized protein n=1 Tax=Cichorium intybus TaxID=13427 RepID=A0ACB9FBK3_CICIN|nr:hypothetical protein L2E82_18744 [Cichorium intybus]
MEAKNRQKEKVKATEDVKEIMNPVYVPTPSNRPLRTPHSGYHFDGTSSKFFEGWYFKVSIPERRQNFCFMYSVENHALQKPLNSLEQLQYGQRFTRVGAQILGADDEYICQYSKESQNFWGSRHELNLGNSFALQKGKKPPNNEVSPRLTKAEKRAKLKKLRKEAKKQGTPVTELEEVQQSSQAEVLIMDKVIVKVMSSVCKMTDITDRRVSLVEDLFKRRQPMPSMDAIYFIQPIKENIVMFSSDMSGREPLYRKYVPHKLLLAGSCLCSSSERLQGSKIRLLRPIKETTAGTRLPTQRLISALLTPVKLPLATLIIKTFL